MMDVRSMKLAETQAFRKETDPWVWVMGPTLLNTYNSAHYRSVHEPQAADSCLAKEYIIFTEARYPNRPFRLLRCKRF